MGLSQRAMAARAHISFKGLQLLEKPRHNWRIDTVEHILEALGKPVAAAEWAVEQMMLIPVNSMADVSVRICLDGFASWKLHLFNAVDAFRAARDDQLLADPPVPQLHAKARALLASVTETLCAEIRRAPPPWCAGIGSLAEPWFVAGVENLKASALMESPVRFRKRNLFVLHNFLHRA